ncbi:hypothetical protein [Sphingomonas sp. URHD0057]|uniref:hypothetical protein n=1 Tax=Sphingomonas sp. URHD0057 TaxID=1380389 RepID=UPI000685D67E|nr:hypothetical protein [Sphingomonas sp. URHD0057]
MIALLLLLATPTVSAEQRKAAIAAVKAELKDADSAKFRDLRPMDGKGGVCGWVNAKNSYGGYIGFSVFYFSSDGKVAILPPDVSEPSLCE